MSTRAVTDEAGRHGHVTVEQESSGLALELEPTPVRAPAIIETGPAKPLPPTFGASPLDQLEALLARGISLEQVREYLALQREWEAEEARRSFHAAMAAFKREELPAILKRHDVNYPTKDQGGQINGRVEYSHEALSDVVESAVPAMAKHGLTHKWVPTQAGKDLASMLITVRCVVTHERGHSDFVELYAAPDTSGKKNPIQSVKSAISYLERITLLAITGLAAKGMDDDGRSTADAGDAPRSRGKPETREPQERPAAPAQQGASNAPTGYASEKQIGLMVRRCKECHVLEADLCEALKVPGLSDVPRGRVDEALKWIEAHRS